MTTSTFRTLFSISLLAAALMATACAGSPEDADEATDEASTPAAATEVATPTASQVANATYDGIFDQPVTLTGGVYEGEPFEEGGASLPRLDLLSELTTQADLDNDGIDEALAFLTSNTGGTGVNLHVAVLEEQDGETVNTATALVGDRVRIRSIEASNGHLRLDVLQAGDEDAMCCPGELATREWALDADGLSEVTTEVTGRFSLATVAGDWTLTHLDFEEPAPADSQVTLTIGADGTISGTSGCNQFNGSMKDLDVGSVEVGPLATTRMACPPPQMELEQKFLQRLGGVNAYGFYNGRLSLDWEHQESYGLLLFAAAQRSP